MTRRKYLLLVGALFCAVGLVRPAFSVGEHLYFRSWTQEERERWLVMNDACIYLQTVTHGRAKLEYLRESQRQAVYAPFFEEADRLHREWCRR